ncbi:pectinesterase PPME1-like [Tripterygium wilfordii]|uniref:pectinesterase PPME1-like n=1 Tax=Tripterygium wilfordii TaxID=458696 RepID=UPI0018F84E36|nr:pectinesterase PPME1-like [Tripterygium wilfordii]
MSTKNAIVSIYAAVATILLISPIVISHDTTPIPADAAQVSNWFKANVKSLGERKATLDPALAAAEASVKVIKVSKSGGQFKTINEAIKSIPSGNKQRVIISIGPGEYKEKVTIDRSKPFVTLYGAPNAMPTIVYSGTAAQYGTVNSATLITESDYFVAANIIVKNSAPRPDGKRKGAQAVAARISGDKSAMYNCKLIGFQDTLCDDKGLHFFKDCLITGTVDFIFGNAKSLYLNTELNVIPEGGFTVITAHARQNNAEDTGYAFVHCKVTGGGKGTYLGRAWMPNPKVIFAYSDLGNAVAPAGWSDNFKPERAKTVFFGEYQCKGPGSNHATRAKFTKNLAPAQANQFLSLGFIHASKWLLPPPKM